MSGICGIVVLDGSEPSAAQIEAVMRPLERRGPDGSRHWRGGRAALGHTLLATTPEALVEVLPLTDPESGCTITADVRLDNRDELIAALGLRDERRVIGDGELILRSYLRWGDECPTHLLGDFAFAIWDPASARLFCARDHMGMRQLIYHHSPDKLFVFGTEPRAVLALPDVPRRINGGRIADFLDRLEGIDLTSTFFQGVYRLPPAHSLTIVGRALSLRRYWALQPGPELMLGSDQAYVEAFLKVFTEAVRCRLRSVGPVGSMLSGGIDSNSVSAVASRLLSLDAVGPLLTFSAVGPDPQNCPETRMVLAAIATNKASATLINHANLGDQIDPLVDMARDCAEPFDGYTTLLKSVYLAAHRKGVNVMLDGAGGDVILTAGNRVAQLMRQGSFREAFSEACGEQRFGGPSSKFSRTLSQAAWAAFVPSWIRGVRRRIMSSVNDQLASFGYGTVAKNFAKTVNLKARRKKYRGGFSSLSPASTEYRAQSIRQPHLVVARERYDRISSALYIEPRDPFLDLRLVSFCLSLPPGQLQSGGWPKLILRRAMEGAVTSDVVWRTGKEHLGWAFTKALLNSPAGRQLRFSCDRERLARYVSSNPSRLRGVSSEVDIEKEFELTFLWWWLKRNLPPSESL